MTFWNRVMCMGGELWAKRATAIAIRIFINFVVSTLQNICSQEHIYRWCSSFRVFLKLQSGPVLIDVISGMLHIATKLIALWLLTLSSLDGRSVLSLLSKKICRRPCCTGHSICSYNSWLFNANVQMVPRLSQQLGHLHPMYQLYLKTV